MMESRDSKQLGKVSITRHTQRKGRAAGVVQGPDLWPYMYASVGRQPATQILTVSALQRCAVPQGQHLRQREAPHLRLRAVERKPRPHPHRPRTQCVFAQQESGL